MRGPALAMIEFKSVARGIVATDQMIKKAPIQVLETHPICPGKYMVLIGGEVADVEEAFNVGTACAADMLVNDFILPFAHHGIIPALTGTSKIENFKSLGIIETFSVASCLKASDIAAKEAPIDLVEIRLGNGLGGKGYFVINGELSDVEIAIESAKKYICKEGMLAGAEIIAAPHPEFIEKGVYW